MEEYKKKQPGSRKQVFLRFIRYVAVAVVTVWLLLLLIASTDKDDFGVAFLAVFFFLYYNSSCWFLDLFFCQGCMATHKNR